MDIGIIVASSLATFRLTELLICDTGPADIIERARNFLRSYPFFSDVLSCYYCLSVWIALFVTLYLWSINLVTGQSFVLYAVSISGGAVICQRAIRRRF